MTSSGRVRPMVLRTAGDPPSVLLEPVLGRSRGEPLLRRGTVGGVEGVELTERVVELDDAFDLDPRRETLLLDAREAGVGVALLGADRAAPGAGLLVCDLDSTLVDGEGIDLLAARAGREEEVARLTEQAMRGERDFEASLRERVRTLDGLREADVAETAAALRLHPGVEEGAAVLRARGWTLAIASGGFVPLARAVADRIGARWVCANTLESHEGTLTGRVAGRVVDGRAKAEFLETCRARLGGRVPVVAIGDGANDAAMLGAAEVAVAYRPKPALLRAAQVVSMHPDLRVALALAGILPLQTRGGGD